MRTFVGDQISNLAQPGLMDCKVFVCPFHPLHAPSCEQIDSTHRGASST